jgi:hypothetical protein
MKSELFICEIMMVFNTLVSYFHKNSLHYFKGLFNDETNPSIRHVMECAMYRLQTIVAISLFIQKI